jgi:hypothetical protein
MNNDKFVVVADCPTCGTQVELAITEQFYCTKCQRVVFPKMSVKEHIKQSESKITAESDFNRCRECGRLLDRGHALDCLLLKKSRRKALIEARRCHAEVEYLNWKGQVINRDDPDDPQDKIIRAKAARCRKLA